MISEATAKTHVARILLKLGLRDRVQAAVLAYEQGVVQVGQDDRQTPQRPSAQPGPHRTGAWERPVAPPVGVQGGRLGQHPTLSSMACRCSPRLEGFGRDHGIGDRQNGSAAEFHAHPAHIGYLAGEDSDPPGA